MKEKKSDLPLILLILAIIAIAIMGIFIYKLINDNNQEKEIISELTEQINVLNQKSNVEHTDVVEYEDVEIKEENLSSQESNSIIGVYKAEVTDSSDALGTGKGEVKLVLNEDYTFAYYYVPNYETHYEGYYTVEKSIITLHILLSCGNDIGATVVDKTLKLEFNNGNVIDNKELNVTLKKSDEKLLVDNGNLLYNSFKTRIQSNVIR